MIAGAAIAVVLWLAIVLRRWRHDRHGAGARMFPAALAAFGLGSLALIPFGRVSSGLMAMTASRYLGLSACFWAGLLLLAGLHTETLFRLVARERGVLAVVAIVAATGASSGRPAEHAGRVDPSPPRPRSAAPGRRRRGRRGALSRSVQLQRRRDVLRDHRPFALGSLTARCRRHAKNVSLG